MKSSKCSHPGCEVKAVSSREVYDCWNDKCPLYTSLWRKEKAIHDRMFASRRVSGGKSE